VEKIAIIDNNTIQVIIIYSIALALTAWMAYIALKEGKHHNTK